MAELVVTGIKENDEGIKTFLKELSFDNAAPKVDEYHLVPMDKESEETKKFVMDLIGIDKFVIPEAKIQMWGVIHEGKILLLYLGSLETPKIEDPGIMVLYENIGHEGKLWLNDVSISINEAVTRLASIKMLQELTKNSVNGDIDLSDASQVKMALDYHTMNKSSGHSAPNPFNVEGER